MSYATLDDLKGRIIRPLNEDEERIAANLLDDAAVIIDSYNPNADAAPKKIVSCNMVIRALGDGNNGMMLPMGTTQGTASALGYSQTFTMGNGAIGELYLTKVDKDMLGLSNRIGSHSPIEDM